MSQTSLFKNTIKLCGPMGGTDLNIQTVKQKYFLYGNKTCKNNLDVHKHQLLRQKYSSAI